MTGVRINGARIAYQQLGDGPDLLLVHGLAASRAFWFAPYAAALKTRYRVTLFDLRGHGYSETTANGYSATSMADDIAGLLNHLRIDTARIVGHSYGGGAALEFAAAYPARVQQLGILDTRVHRLQPYQRLHDIPFLSPAEKAIAEQTEHDWESEPQVGFKFLEAAARWRLRNAPAASEIVKQQKQFVPFSGEHGNGRVARQWLKLIEQTDASREFLIPGATAEHLAAALTMPVWLAYGERSRCLPSLEALHALLPHAKVDVIAEAGHFFPISHAPQVLPKLQNFLDETTVTTETGHQEPAITPALSPTGAK